MIEAAWSLFILVMLLITALFSSYLLQTRKIQAVHETVMSIFAGETCYWATQNCADGC